MQNAILFFLGFMSFLPQLSKAQNFRCLVDGEPHYYRPLDQNWNNELLGCQVTEIEVDGTDTIYWLSNNPTRIAGNVDCNGSVDSLENRYVNFLGAGWMGEKMLIKEDGWNLFFGENGDTVFINTSAQLGETWDFVINPSLHVSATVTDISNENINGLLQSVKTIELQKLSGSYSAFPNLDQVEWKLSEHYGLVSFTPIYLAPESLPGNNLFWNYGINLNSGVAITDFVQLSVAEVFDYQIGDEYQTHRNTHDSFYSQDEFILRRVISRMNYGADSIEYVFEYQIDRIFEYYPDPPNSTHILKFDTIIIKNLNTPFPFGMLPRQMISGAFPSNLQPVADGQSAYPSLISTANYGSGIKHFAEVLDTFCGVELRSYVTTGTFALSDISNSCAIEYEQVGSFLYNYKYVVPKIGIYHANTGTFQQGFGNFLYINTSQYQCGELQYVGISETKKEKLSLHPNPATSTLQFSSKEKGVLQILDAQGRTVHSQSVVRGPISLNIKGLPTGVFVIRIVGENHISSGRFVKR